MSKSERATKIVFWLAFGAFLAMSIPHLAWLFRYYEPRHDSFDMLWWLISYGVAFSIDVLICWLSYTRSEQQQSSGDGIITWVFIVLLAILSWYCNWIFSEAMIGVDVWEVTLGYGWTVGNLTPFIVSAIPVFMIAYTYMSRKIIGAKSRVKSAEELKQEANELEATLSAKQRINDLKNAGFSAWIVGKKKVWKEAFAGEDLPVKVEPIPGDLNPDMDTNIPELEEQSTEESTTPEPRLSLVQSAPEAVKPSQYLMTFEEASAYTGYAVSSLKKQVHAGEIQANKTGEKLKVSSLKIRGNTAKLSAIKVEKIPATNGHH